MAGPLATPVPSNPPTQLNISESILEAELVEEIHEFDALSALALNLVLIGCLLLAYAVKKFRIYSLPESAGALLVGMMIGGIVRLTTEDMTLFAFSPEVFFFVLLPPIIFEAGYSLDRKGFFENIGAITLYAFFGTIISTFTVGILCFYAAKVGMISGIDKENPMESLIFGSLISSVDPVAILSIMGNPDLGVDPLLYSLVFGESVLNDAIAISLFKTFFEFYKPEGPKWSESQIPLALLSFVVITVLSIMVGVGLGLVASWLYRHLDLRQYPHLETSLLLCFCYLCYATAESISLSGIMALFFQGVVLSHYNSYNLSEVSHVASEQIFSTFATLTETIVFVYMGMGVFTGRYKTFDMKFPVIAMGACVVGRLLNIVPLSFLSNLCRRGRHVISGRHQAVLCFSGLRGAIAYALSENMPGPHKEVYTTGTLSICIFTTIVCGSFTERVLTIFGMKDDDRLSYMAAATATAVADNNNNNNSHESADLKQLRRLSYRPPVKPSRESRVELKTRKIREGIKGLWYRFDDEILKPQFGGNIEESSSPQQEGAASHEGPPPSLEMGSLSREDHDGDEEDAWDDDDDDNDPRQHQSLLRH